MCGVTVGVVKKENSNSGDLLQDNKFITLGDVTRDGNAFTFEIGFSWQINGETYANTTIFPFEINNATDSFFRTDIAYVNDSNEIFYLQGEEDPNVPKSPDLPLNSLLLATWSIYGNIISDAVISNLGNSYVSKSFYNEQIVIGHPEYIDIATANGQMSFAFKNSDGAFDFLGLTNYQTYRGLFDGKQTTFKNLTGFPITLKNQAGANNIKFNFSTASDYILQPNELIVLRFSNQRGLENLYPIDYIQVTKEQLDSLINSKQLKPSFFYKITNVHPTLYNDGNNAGTTIFLQAIATNKIAIQGNGLFYNPKYDAYPMYKQFSSWKVSNVVGNFNDNELVYLNSDTGFATGTLLNNVYTNYFAFNNDFNGAFTSITGTVTGATADINDVSILSYNIGDKVCFGGYVWQNVTGNIGTPIDVLNLSEDWEKLTYNTDDYNLVFDPIEYDYSNDFIVKRTEVEFSNEVVFNKTDFDTFQDAYGINYSAISVFKFGNGLVYLGAGLKANKINNSYFENVNEINSIFYFNSISSGLYIANNTFDNFQFFENNFIGANSNISQNLFKDSIVVGNNSINGMGIIQNTICNNTSGIRGVEFNNASQIINNVFKPNSNINKCEFLDGSALTNNSFSEVLIQSNKFLNSSIESNNLNATQLMYATFIDAQINTNLNLTPNVFLLTDRTIYKRPDGSLKLRYFDNTDKQIVESIV